MYFEPKQKINIKYLELVVTTKCTLKCKDCSNLMPLYKKPYSVELETIKESLSKLLEVVESVELLRVLGGEPLLHKDLCEIIKFILNQEKIKNIHIVTNGTIYPRNKNLIDVMKNQKLKVVISDYGLLSNQKDELLKMKSIYGINTELIRIDYWLDYGKINCRKRTTNDLEKQYKRCNHQCLSLFNGGLYECPRCGHGMDLGIIEKKEKEYINLLEKNVDVIYDDLIYMFFGNRRFISACNYCDVETEVKKIPIAIQL